VTYDVRCERDSGWRAGEARQDWWTSESVSAPDGTRRSPREQWDKEEKYQTPQLTV